MRNLDILKRKVSELENLADEIERLGTDLLQKAPLTQKTHPVRLEWDILTSDLRNTQREAIQKYQRWYNLAHQLIKEYIPEKENEFIDCYETKGMYKSGIFDYLHLRSGTERDDKNKLIKYFVGGFETQRSILLSIPDVAEIKELNLRKIITADVARTGIEQAEILLINGFERAAGSIAGVALELHLKTLCDVNGIFYAPKDTIDPLATILYKAGILDITELKHIQYLASIRNKCSHPNPISATEIKDLIEDVKKLV